MKEVPLNLRTIPDSLLYLSGAIWLAFLFSPDLASAQRYVSGVWEGDRYDDDAGKFSYCSVVRYYEDGVGLSIAITRAGDLVIRLASDKPNFSEGDSYGARLDVDGGDRQTVFVRVLSPTVIRLDVERSKAAFDSLRRGHSLNIALPDRSFRLSLKDASTALDKLFDCFSSALEMEARNDGASDTDGVEKDAAAGIAEGFAREVISYMSGDDIRVLDAASEPFIRLLKAAFAWRTKHGFSLADGLPSLSPDAAIWIRIITDRDRTSCLEDFASHTSSHKFGPESQKHMTVFVLKTSCLRHRHWDKPVHGVYSFFPLASENMVLITHITNAPDDAIAADERFSEAANKWIEVVFNDDPK